MTPAEAYAALVAAGGEVRADGRRLVVRAPQGAPAEVRANALQHKKALWWLQSGNAAAERETWTERRTARWLDRAQAHLERGLPREHCGPLAFLEVAPEPEPPLSVAEAEALVAAGTWRAELARWSKDDRYLFDERAVIMTYDGGMSVETVEPLAFVDTVRALAEAPSTPPPAAESGEVSALPFDTAVLDPLGRDRVA